MQKIIAFLCFFVIITIQNIAAQSYSVMGLSSSFTENADEIVRHASIRFEVKSPSDAIERRSYVITLWNRNSEANILREYYDAYSKITYFKATLYDKWGNELKTTTKKDVQDVSAFSGVTMYSDNRLKIINLAHNDYPYTIAYDVERVHKEIRNYPDWNIVPNYATAVEKTSYKVILANGLDIVYKNFNTNVTPTISTDEKGQKQYEWTAENIPAVAYEPFSPPSSRVLPSVHILPTQFEVKGYQGSMASWNDFGAFMYKLNEGNDLLSPEMKTMIAEKTANVATDAEKVAILYKYLQETMRYISVQWGIGSWKSFDANYVEKNKYGDCKALTWFMKAMLKEANIVAYPALIDGGYDPYEHTSDFAESRFSHVILHVPSTGHWLECTSKDMPCGYVSTFNDNRTTLLITENGGKLTKTPSLPISTTTRNVEIKVNTNGDAIINSKKEMFAEAHEYYREYKNRLSEAEQKKRLQEGIALPSYTINSFKVEVDDLMPKATFEYEISVPAFASKAGTRLFVPINALDNIDFIPKEVKNRRLPVLVRSDSYTETNVVLHIPEGYAIEDMVEVVPSIQTEFGDYHLSLKKENDKLTLYRKLRLKKYEGTPDSYEKMRDFYKMIKKSDAIKIVLVKR